MHIRPSYGKKAVIEAYEIPQRCQRALPKTGNMRIALRNRLPAKQLCEEQEAGKIHAQREKQHGPTQKIRHRSMLRQNESRDPIAVPMRGADRHILRARMDI